MSEIIVALDQPSASAAMELVQRIEGLRWVKVGPVLFVREGPRLLERLKHMDLMVFLDMKWHDIPSTVSKAVGNAEEIGVDLATVHAIGGTEMLEAATESRSRMKLVAVSVLTSHSDDSISEALGKPTDAASEASRLTHLAWRAGVDGMVCSAREIEAVKTTVGPDGLVVVPGIRLATDLPDDQKRIATPAQATLSGATHLVVGRPITRSDNPADSFKSFSMEAAACQGSA